MTISLKPYYFTKKIIPKRNKTVSEKGRNVNINNEEKTKQDRQCANNVTLRRVHATILQWKTIRITYSECVFVALGNQHATRRHRIILSLVACPYL
jgi:hypothetical protein